MIWLVVIFIISMLMYIIPIIINKKNNNYHITNDSKSLDCKYTDNADKSLACKSSKNNNSKRVKELKDECPASPFGKVVEPISVSKTPIHKTIHQRDLISTEICMYDVEEKFADLEPLPYRSSHAYKIKGTNPNTGRRKTYNILAFDEQHAAKKAISHGIIEPFEITLNDTPATEAQKDFMRDLGLTIKEEYTVEDASCILSRTHEREPSPEQWLFDFAVSNDIPFSLYATNGNIIYHIRKEYFTDIIKELSFWVFCVNKAIYNDTVFHEDEFNRIANELSNNAEFMRFYSKNVSEHKIDYINPNTRTTVYKMTKEALVN